MLRKWGGYMFSKENYKMIATDLDGTLLDKESKISTYTLEVLKKLKEKGIELDEIIDITELTKEEIEKL